MDTQHGLLVNFTIVHLLSNTLFISLILEWSASNLTARPMDIVTNSFCAVCRPAQFIYISTKSFLMQGGSALGNGTWLNVGGNQAITYGGAKAKSQTGGGPYDDLDGGYS